MAKSEKKEKKLIALITGEKKEKEKAEQQQKQLHKVVPKGEVQQDYTETSVEEIVRRMEKKYKEKGILEEEQGMEVTRGEKLKEMVVGVTPMHLDRRCPEDFVQHKSVFLQLVGHVYVILKFMNKVTDRIAMWNTNQTLPVELNKANMDYSVRQYVSIAVVAAIIAIFFLFFLLAMLLLTVLGFLVEDYLVGLPTPVIILMKIILAGMMSFLGGFVMLFVALKFPTGSASKRGIEIDRELPFALRQMATEIRAGIGIHGSLRSLVKSDYGTLSDEFARVLRDIEKGKSTEDALDEMVIRSPSESLATAGIHMIRAIRTGGNLSDIISQIADEVAFKLRMKMRGFVSKLNLIGLFYMMIGVIMPVLLAVLAAVFTAVPVLGLQGILGPETLFLLYFVVIPGMLGTLLYMVKTLQPM